MLSVFTKECISSVQCIINNIENKHLSDKCVDYRMSVLDDGNLMLDFENFENDRVLYFVIDKDDGSMVFNAESLSAGRSVNSDTKCGEIIKNLIDWVFNVKEIKDA